ncbi:unnamed protein product, partial [Prorocentrum cordatum]
AAGGADPAVLPGPREPCWGCPCGHAGKWACRVRCQRCGKPAPQRIADAARAAAKKRPPREAVPAPDTPGEHRQRSAGGGQAPGPVSYAALVQRLLPSPSVPAAPPGDVAMPSPVAAGASPDAPATELSQAQREFRYWRERRTAAQRYAAEADVAECDRQIRASLELAAQASRPWAVRVQAAADLQKAAAAKLQATTDDLAEARRAVVHFEAEAAKAQEALRLADAALLAVQAEATPARAPPPAQLTEAGVDAAFATLAAATSVLQQRGGGSGGGGGGEAAALVEQLRALVAAAVRGAAAEVPAAGAAAAAAGPHPLGLLQPPVPRRLQGPSMLPRLGAWTLRLGLPQLPAAGHAQAVLGPPASLLHAAALPGQAGAIAEPRAGCDRRLSAANPAPAPCPAAPGRRLPEPCLGNLTRARGPAAPGERLLEPWFGNPAPALCPAAPGERLPEQWRGNPASAPCPAAPGGRLPEASPGNLARGVRVDEASHPGPGRGGATRSTRTVVANVTSWRGSWRGLLAADADVYCVQEARVPVDEGCVAAVVDGARLRGLRLQLGASSDGTHLLAFAHREGLHGLRAVDMIGFTSEQDNEALLVAAVSWLRSLGDVQALLVGDFNLVLHGTSVEPLLAMAGWQDVLAHLLAELRLGRVSPTKCCKSKGHRFVLAFATVALTLPGARWRLPCLEPLVRQYAGTKWHASRPRASGAGGEASDKVADAALLRARRLRSMREIASRWGLGCHRARAVAAALVRDEPFGGAWTADLQRLTAAPGLLESCVLRAELERQEAQRAARDRRRGSWHEWARQAMANGGGRLCKWIRSDGALAAPFVPDPPAGAAAGRRGQAIIRAMAKNKAPGLGGWAVAELRLLPRELLEWVAELFEFVEQTGRWPIWLLPMLHHVWAAGRAQLFARWRAAWGDADGSIGSEELACNLALELEVPDPSWSVRYWPCPGFVFRGLLGLPRLPEPWERLAVAAAGWGGLV